MQAKRNDFLTGIVVSCLDLALSTYYHLEFEHPEYLEQAGKGFILLPKHQSYVDCPLEGIFLKQTLHAHAYYLNRPHVLPCFNGITPYLGGLEIIRPTDVRNVPPEQRREALQQAHARNEEVFALLPLLLDQGEIVVIHPEQKRNYKTKGTANKQLLEKLTSLPTQHAPLFVPLDINYEESKKFRSPILITAGEPLQTRDADTLDLHLKRYIRLLE